MKTVTANTLKSMLHDGGELALLDVREAGQFGESHLLFATPCPYSRLEIEVISLVPRRSARVVLCDDGTSDVAPRAATRLDALGYTDVAVLDGGTAAWAAAGYALFKGVNVPSKLFGEMVEHDYGTPRVTAQELVRMKESGEDFVLLDGRPVNEHHKMTIPGSTCCPNAELPYRIATMVRSPNTKIVVNCAGRTRSILGAQTLINFGVPNPVYALENGTQGWYLRDLQLEHGSTRRYPQVDAGTLPALQDAAKRLMRRFGIKTVAADEAAAWLKDERRTTYLCDVRTPEEYTAGSVPGAVHAPGGQLIQATDQWIGVRHARVVLIDGGENIRAPVVASWLVQLGFDPWVLDGGVRARLDVAPPALPPLPHLAEISASELKQALEAGACAVFDLDPSMDFRKAHIPDSRWSTRVRLAVDAQGERRMIVLASGSAELARLAATELAATGASGVKLLKGGVGAWTQAGYAAEASPAMPADAECIDYLFFVHDRHAGNREAMRRYLAWETGLMAQLDAQDRSSFRIGPPK